MNLNNDHHSEDVVQQDHSERSESMNLSEAPVDRISASEIDDVMNDDSAKNIDIDNSNKNFDLIDSAFLEYYHRIVDDRSSYDSL